MEIVKIYVYFFVCRYRHSGLKNMFINRFGLSGYLTAERAEGRFTALPLKNISLNPGRSAEADQIIRTVERLHNELRVWTVWFPPLA